MFIYPFRRGARLFLLSPAACERMSMIIINNRGIRAYTLPPLARGNLSSEKKCKSSPPLTF